MTQRTHDTGIGAAWLRDVVKHFHVAMVFIKGIVWQNFGDTKQCQYVDVFLQCIA